MAKFVYSEDIINAASDAQAFEAFLRENLSERDEANTKKFLRTVNKTITNLPNSGELAGVLARVSESNDPRGALETAGDQIYGGTQEAYGRAQQAFGNLVDSDSLSAAGTSNIADAQVNYPPAAAVQDYLSGDRGFGISAVAQGGLRTLPNIVGGVATAVGGAAVGSVLGGPFGAAAGASLAGGAYAGIDDYQSTVAQSTIQQIQQSGRDPTNVADVEAFLAEGGLSDQDIDAAERRALAVGLVSTATAGLASKVGLGQTVGGHIARQAPIGVVGSGASEAAGQLAYNNSLDPSGLNTREITLEALVGAPAELAPAVGYGLQQAREKLVKAEKLQTGDAQGQPTNETTDAPGAQQTDAEALEALIAEAIANEDWDTLEDLLRQKAWQQAGKPTDLSPSGQPTDLALVPENALAVQPPTDLALPPETALAESVLSQELDVTEGDIDARIEYGGKTKEDTDIDAIIELIKSAPIAGTDADLNTLSELIETALNAGTNAEMKKALQAALDIVKSSNANAANPDLERLIETALNAGTNAEMEAALKAAQENDTQNAEGDGETEGEYEGEYEGDGETFADEDPYASEDPLNNPDADNDSDTDADNPVKEEVESITNGENIPPTETVNAADIGLNEEAFQFRAKGTSKRLANIKKWDTLAAGEIVVFERADGTREVADGHHRVRLAKKLADKTGAKTPINARVFKEKDGYTEEGLRAMGAVVNLKNNNASPLDAAVYLKETGKVPDKFYSTFPSTAVDTIEKGFGISQLADTPFAVFLKNEPSEGRSAYYSAGAIIGEQLENPAAQEAAIAAIVQQINDEKTLTKQFIQTMVDTIKETDANEALETENLFGSDEQATKDFMELVRAKAKLISGVKNKVTKDQALSKQLLKNKDNYENIGDTKIDRTAAETAKIETKRTKDAVHTFINRTDVNALINEQIGKILRKEIKSADAIDTIIATIQNVAEENIAKNRENASKPTDNATEASKPKDTETEASDTSDNETEADTPSDNEEGASSPLEATVQKELSKQIKKMFAKEGLDFDQDTEQRLATLNGFITGLDQAGYDETSNTIIENGEAHITATPSTLMHEWFHAVHSWTDTFQFSEDDKTNPGAEIVSNVKDIIGDLLAKEVFTTPEGKEATTDAIRNAKASELTDFGKTVQEDMNSDIHEAFAEMARKNMPDDLLDAIQMMVEMEANGEIARDGKSNQSAFFFTTKKPPPDSMLPDNKAMNLMRKAKDNKIYNIAQAIYGEFNTTLGQAEMYADRIGPEMRKVLDDFIASAVGQRKVTGIRSKDAGFVESVELETNHFINRMDNLFKTHKLDKEDKETAQDFIELRRVITGQNTKSPKLKAAAEDIRALLEDYRKYAVKKGYPLGKWRENGYFPRVYDSKKVADNPEKFVDLAQQVYEKDADEKAAKMKELFNSMLDKLSKAERKKVDRVIKLTMDNRKTIDVTEALKKVTLQPVAEAITKKYVEAQLHKNSIRTKIDGERRSKFLAQAWADRLLTGKDMAENVSASSDHANQRLLGSVADKLLTGFMMEDPREVMSKYFSSMTKAVEYHAKWKTTDIKKTVMLALQKAKQEKLGKGLTEYERGIFTATIDASLLAHAKKDEKITFAVSTITAGAILARAAFSSLPEPLVAGLSTERGLNGLINMKNFAVIASSKNKRKTLKDVNDLLGITQSSLINTQVLALFGNEEAAQQKAKMRKLVPKFFIGNLMSVITQAHRTATSTTADSYLRFAAKHKKKGDTRFSDEIEALGITDIDKAVEFIDQATPEMLMDRDNPVAQEVRLYKYRVTEDTIMNPKPHTRTRLANHPWGGLAFGITSFTFAFTTKVVLPVLQKAMKKAKSGNIGEVMEIGLALGGLIVTHAAVAAIRDQMFNDEEHREKDWTVFLKRAISQSGFLGVPDIPYNIVAAARYKKTLSDGLVGPAFAYLLTQLTTINTYLVAKDDSYLPYKRKQAARAFARLGVFGAAVAATYVTKDPKKLMAIGAGNALASSKRGRSAITPVVEEALTP